MANDDFAIGAVGDKKGADKSKGSEAAGASHAASSAQAPQQSQQGGQAGQSHGIDTQDKVNISKEARGLE